MEAPQMLIGLRDELRHELLENILSYWMGHSLDEEHGGFVGRITNRNEIIRDAEKGCVLNARILWSFAAAYRVVEDPAYRDVACRSFDYLSRHFLDREHGGVFWSVDRTGQPRDDRKHVYAQAFALYGLSEYARATGDEAARALAINMYNMLERHASDAAHGGYFEAFSRDWKPLEDVRLSDTDPNAPKSMNTHLHVLEAYTNLYREWPTSSLRERLVTLVDLFCKTMYDSKTRHLRPFFDEAWRPGPLTVSYGHDIEASWLLMEAAEVLADPALLMRVRKTSLDIARATLDEGVDEDGGLFNEAFPDGSIDTDKHWWPQAEAIVGFVNAFQESGDIAFLEAAVATWEFIREKIVDSVHGEWFFRVDRHGRPYEQEDKVGPWKCPYHNARACLEVMTRVDELEHV